MRRLDLVGQKFGKLEVISDTGNDKQGHSMWNCICDCGNEIIVVSYSLRSGNTKSCGCLKREVLSKPHTDESRQKMSKSAIGKHVGKNSGSYKHGLTKTNGYKNNYSAKRRATKLNQTPADASMVEIGWTYHFCNFLNNTSDRKYEVDHIIPLSKGGIHHQDNLQILTKEVNRKKSNKIIIGDI